MALSIANRCLTVRAIATIALPASVATNAQTTVQEPDLSGLSYKDKNIVEMNCGAPKFRGIAAYRQCLRNQLELAGIDVGGFQTDPAIDTPQAIPPTPPAQPKLSDTNFNRAGYDAGPADGVCGSQKEQVIKRSLSFCRPKHLPREGKNHEHIRQQDLGRT